MSNFDPEFTKEPCWLSPVDHNVIPTIEDEVFEGFSFTNPQMFTASWKWYFVFVYWRGMVVLASSPGSLLKNGGRREPGNIRGINTLNKSGGWYKGTHALRGGVWFSPAPANARSRDQPLQWLDCSSVGGDSVYLHRQLGWPRPHYQHTAITWGDAVYLSTPIAVL